MTVQVEIVSAEAHIFSGIAEMVFATATLGELGIAPRHAQLLTSLKPGQVRVLLPDGHEEVFYISGGMLEVQPHLVTVLADTALRADDIDESAALAAKRAAETAMTERVEGFNYAEANTLLAQAVAQIEAIQSWRKKMKHVGK